MKNDLKWRRKLGRHPTHGPLRSDTSLYEVFHENSKFTTTSSKIAGIRIAALSHNRELLRTLSTAYKVYSLAYRRPLPVPRPESQLERVIAERRSERQYTGEPVTLEQLSRLLFFTYGRTQQQGFFRAIGSAGALYPLELYIFGFRIDGLQPGLYHYAAETHGLHEVKHGDFKDALSECIFVEDTDIGSACMLVVISAVFVRSTIKYADRGYRMTLMECGAAGHNLGLLATAMGLGCVPIGGFLDDRLNELLGIDGIEESVLLPIVVGKRAIPKES